MKDTQEALIPSGTLRQVYFDLSINGYAIPVWNYFQNFSYVRQTSGAGNSGTLTLFDPEWSFLESFILQKNTSMADMEFTYGWSDNYSRAIKAKITKYSPEFSADGVTINLEFYDESVASTFARDNLSFKSGLRISEIVAQYAKERGIIETVIETTRGGFDSPIVKRNCNDLYFLQNELLPRAVNKQGLGGYSFYFDEGGALHFHTPFYNPKQSDAINVYKTYIVYRGMEGEVKTFSPADNAYDQAFMGGAGVLIESVDPKTKKIIKSEANRKTYNGKIITGELPVVSSVKGNPPSRVIKSALTTKDSITDYGKSRFAMYNLSSYNATAEIVGDPKIRINGVDNGNTFVEFIVITSQDRLHPLSGIYWVTKITDTLDGGEYTTSLEMTRTTMNTTRSASEYDLEAKDKIRNILREVRDSNLVTKQAVKQ